MKKMNEHYYLLVIVILIGGYLLSSDMINLGIERNIRGWQYSSDADLQGTQTKYIEADHIRQVKEMNSILNIPQAIEEFYGI